MSESRSPAGGSFSRPDRPRYDRNDRGDRGDRGGRPPRSEGGYGSRINFRLFTARLKPEHIDYKRLDVLVRYLNPIGKIVPARRSGATPKQQTLITNAIKRARFLGLLPYARNDTR
ncbi:30S ribosomal protein S18 [Candidatus Latescibacterota bacterium]